MGIKGSATVVKLGKSARQWGQGVFWVKGALYAPRRVFQKITRNFKQAQSQRSCRRQGWFCKDITKIPGAVGVAGMFGAAGRAIVDKRKSFKKTKAQILLKNKLDMIITFSRRTREPYQKGGKV